MINYLKTWSTIAVHINYQCKLPTQRITLKRTWQTQNTIQTMTRERKCLLFGTKNIKSKQCLPYIFLSHIIWLTNAWQFLQNKPNCWTLNKQVEKVLLIDMGAFRVTGTSAGQHQIQSSSSKSFLPWGALGPPAGLAMMIWKKKTQQQVTVTENQAHKDPRSRLWALRPGRELINFDTKPYLLDSS